MFLGEMLLYKKKPVLLGAMVFVLLSFSLAVSVEASSIFWSYTYGGVPDETSGSSLVATSDGGYVIAGTIKLYDGTSRGVWLIKTDEFGFMEWNQTYESEQSYRASSLVATSDGGYAIAGTMLGDFWLIKTDSFGNMEWNQTYGGPESEEVYSLIETSDGGYAIAGTQPYHPDPDAVYKYANFWLVKTDASGNMVWNETIGTSWDAEEAKSLVETIDGGYAIVGSTSHPKKGGSKLLLVKTDETGFLPEYHSLLLLSLLLIATLVSVINKKRLLQVHKNTKQ